MRVREGGKQEVSYAESPALPTVRSGNLAFDALFALAGNEMKLDSVSEIRDGSYNGGNAIPCECFETGELWHYVWTRDLSYAASLGLGMLDPQRTRNSLEFKLAGYRDGVTPGLHAIGDGYQIVQDTGSGGSWPVSTDRVSWAFGADEALKALPTSSARHSRPRPCTRCATRWRTTASPSGMPPTVCTRARSPSSTGANKATLRGCRTSCRSWPRPRRCPPTRRTTRR
jgi:hypothetical protein